MTAPGLAGTTGTLNFTYYVHGVTSDPDAKGKVLVSVDSTDVYTDPAAAIAFVQNIDGADSFAGKGAIGVSFQFGGANDIETALGLESERGTINFDDTVELIGIQALNSAGKPVAASIIGDSGIDYVALAASTPPRLAWTAAASSGVPEASTWAMLLIGFAGLGGAALRRCAKRRHDGVTLKSSHRASGVTAGDQALRDWRPEHGVSASLIESESDANSVACCALEPEPWGPLAQRDRNCWVSMPLLIEDCPCHCP